MPYNEPYPGAAVGPTGRIVFPPPVPIVPRPLAKCPVCDGKTTVPWNFYPGNLGPRGERVKCRSCGGRGIV